MTAIRPLIEGPHASLSFQRQSDLMMQLGRQRGSRRQAAKHSMRPHNLSSPQRHQLVKCLEPQTVATGKAEAHLLVLQDLAALHGAHDGGVDGMPPVLVHVLHHLPPLVLGRRRDLQPSTPLSAQDIRLLVICLTGISCSSIGKTLVLKRTFKGYHPCVKISSMPTLRLIGISMQMTHAQRTFT